MTRINDQQVREILRESGARLREAAQMNDDEEVSYEYRRGVRDAVQGLECDCRRMCFIAYAVGYTDTVDNLQREAEDDDAQATFETVFQRDLVGADDEF